MPYIFFCKDHPGSIEQRSEQAPAHLEFFDEVHAG